MDTKIFGFYHSSLGGRRFGGGGWLSHRYWRFQQFKSLLRDLQENLVVGIHASQHILYFRTFLLSYQLENSYIFNTNYYRKQSFRQITKNSTVRDFRSLSNMLFLDEVT